MLYSIMYWPGKVIYLYDYYCKITAFFKRSLDVLLNPTMFFILSLYQVWIWTGLISGESYLSLNTTIQRWILKWFKIYSHKAKVIIKDIIFVKFIYTVSYFAYDVKPLLGLSFFVIFYESYWTRYTKWYYWVLSCGCFILYYCTSS